MHKSSVMLVQFLIYNGDSHTNPFPAYFWIYLGMQNQADKNNITLYETPFIENGNIPALDTFTEKKLSSHLTVFLAIEILPTKENENGHKSTSTTDTVYLMEVSSTSVYRSSYAAFSHTFADRGSLWQPEHTQFPWSAAVCNMTIKPNDITISLQTVADIQSAASKTLTKSPYKLKDSSAAKPNNNTHEWTKLLPIPQSSLFGNNSIEITHQPECITLIQDGQTPYSTIFQNIKTDAQKELFNLAIDTLVNDKNRLNSVTDFYLLCKELDHDQIVAVFSKLDSRKSSAYIGDKNFSFDTLMREYPQLLPHYAEKFDSSRLVQMSCLKLAIEKIVDAKIKNCVEQLYIDLSGITSPQRELTLTLATHSIIAVLYSQPNGDREEKCKKLKQAIEFIAADFPSTWRKGFCKNASLFALLALAFGGALVFTGMLSATAPISVVLGTTNALGLVVSVYGFFCYKHRAEEGKHLHNYVKNNTNFLVSINSATV